MHIQHEGWPIYLQNERSQLLALQNDGGSPRISKDRHENQSCWTGTCLQNWVRRCDLYKMMVAAISWNWCHRSWLTEEIQEGIKNDEKTRFWSLHFFCSIIKQNIHHLLTFSFKSGPMNGFLGFNLTWRTEDVLSFEPPVRLLKFRPCETDVAQKPTSRCKSGVGDADRLLIAACVALATGAHPGEVLGYARTERKMDDNGEAFNLALSSSSGKWSATNQYKSVMTSAHRWEHFETTVLVTLVQNFQRIHFCLI